MQLLACIGEQFDEGDEICGIVVNLRARQDRLCVWTKTAHNEAAQVLPISFERDCHVPVDQIQYKESDHSVTSLALIRRCFCAGIVMLPCLEMFAWLPAGSHVHVMRSFVMNLQVSIARQLKDFLDVPEGNKLGYLPHVSLDIPACMTFICKC